MFDYIYDIFLNICEMFVGYNFDNLPRILSNLFYIDMEMTQEHTEFAIAVFIALMTWSFVCLVFYIIYKLFSFIFGKVCDLFC